MLFSRSQPKFSLTHHLSYSDSIRLFQREVRTNLHVQEPRWIYSRKYFNFRSLIRFVKLKYPVIAGPYWRYFVPLKFCDTCLVNFWNSMGKIIEQYFYSLQFFPCFLLGGGGYTNTSNLLTWNVAVFEQKKNPKGFSLDCCIASGLHLVKILISVQNLITHPHPRRVYLRLISA